MFPCQLCHHHPQSSPTLLQQPAGVLKDLTQNANARVPGDLSLVLRHQRGPDCPLTCDSEDINRCEGLWRSRLAVIIQMKDYEKGRAVTPPAGPKQADAGRDVWLLVTLVSRRESAPSAGIASRPFEDSFSLISNIILPLASLSHKPTSPLGLFLQTFSRKEDKSQ